MIQRDTRLRYLVFVIFVRLDLQTSSFRQVENLERSYLNSKLSQWNTSLGTVERSVSQDIHFCLSECDNKRAELVFGTPGDMSRAKFASDSNRNRETYEAIFQILTAAARSVTILNRRYRDGCNFESMDARAISLGTADTLDDSVMISCRDKCVRLTFGTPNDNLRMNPVLGGLKIQSAVICKFEFQAVTKR